MDFKKIAQEQFDQALGGSKAKKTTKTPKKASKGAVDDIIDSVDTAVKNKIPDGAVADIAESAFDQNKDGHIVDDILRMGENLFKKK